MGDDDKAFEAIARHLLDTKKDFQSFVKEKELHNLMPVKKFLTILQAHKILNEPQAQGLRKRTRDLFQDS